MIREASEYLEMKVISKEKPCEVNKEDQPNLYMRAYASYLKPDTPGKQYSRKYALYAQLNKKPALLPNQINQESYFISDALKDNFS